MSGFSAEWLALREPADAAARSSEVTRFVVDGLAGRPGVDVVDLGCGAGSNVRYLSRRLPSEQRWRVVDDDRALLEVARRDLAPGSEVVVADLRRLPERLFDACDLVTASALLDLVSEVWLRDLVERCRRAGVSVLCALNYDGRIECAPHDADDAFVRGLVNEHQRGDKGFGPALGPLAGRRADELLTQAGYRVRRAASDWVVGPEQDALQRALIRGWSHAAGEIAPTESERISGWTTRRLAHVERATSRLLVGHDDVGAVR